MSASAVVLRGGGREGERQPSKRSLQSDPTSQSAASVATLVGAQARRQTPVVCERHYAGPAR